VAVAAGVALIAAAATAAIVLGTRGGTAQTAPREDDLRVFMAKIVREVVHNDYTHAWQSLNPEHQRVAPQPEYVACERLNPIKLALNKVEIVSISNRWFAMPGRDQPVRGKEIKVVITLANPATEERARSTHVFHAVAVGSHWTWVLPAAAYEVYRTDSCA
jgi:hypothetical protein